jgi:hypothetical protein
MLGLRLGIGGLLLLSVTLSLVGPSRFAGTVSLWNWDVPLRWLKVGTELTGAALLLAGGRRLSGAALLAWVVATASVRAAGDGSSSCGCLDTIGGHPALVTGIWVGVLLVGVFDAVTGKPAAGWAGVASCWAASGLLVGGLAVVLRSPGSDAIALQFEAVEWTQGKRTGRLRVENRSDMVLSEIAIQPTCNCVEVHSRLASLAPRERGSALIVVGRHPRWVVPMVLVRGRLGGRLEEATILLDDPKESEAR